MEGLIEEQVKQVDQVSSVFMVYIELFIFGLKLGCTAKPSIKDTQVMLSTVFLLYYTGCRGIQLYKVKSSNLA
jgi:hypothetical protein